MRKSPLKRSKPMRPKKPKRLKSAKSDAKYLARVRELPCCHRGVFDICGGPIEAHHAGRKGVGEKCADVEAIPLCRWHHIYSWHAHKWAFRDWTRKQRRDWADARIAETQAKLGLTTKDQRTSPEEKPNE